MNNPSYIIISPVRNEAGFLPKTIESVAKQTILPHRWVLVNDGSTDSTGALADEAAKARSWIRVVARPDRGFRKAGGGVIEAFYEGYRLIENESWDYLVKLDGDVSFDDDYFEKCFQAFEGDSRLGIAGGTVCRLIGKSLEPESKVDPKFHVRGATKIYRRECWDQIGGLLRAPGWDTMDEVKANMLGWTTGTLSDISMIHYRPTGAAYGAWQDRVKNGMGCYIVGYHPVFMVLKCMSRVVEKPYVVGGCGLFFGFLKGYVNGVAQIEDRALIKYFRGQQMNRLLRRKSLWD